MKKNVFFKIATLSVALIFIISSVASITIFAQTNEETLQRLSSENTALSQEIENAKQGQQQEQTKINDYEQKKAELTQSIDTITSDILNKAEDIKAQSSQIAQTQEEIDQTKDELKTRVRAFYTTGEASFFDMLFNCKNVMDFFDKLYITKIVSDHDNKLISDLNSLNTTQNKQLDELTQSHNDLLAQKDELSNATLEYNTLISEANTNLEQYSSQEQSAAQKISENNSQIEAINAEIEAYYAKLKAEQEAQRQAEQEAQRQAVAYQQETQDTNDYSQSEAEQQQQEQYWEEVAEPTPTVPEEESYVPSDPVSSGSYVWPCPGFYELSSPYNEARSGYCHGGIDISGSGIYGAAVVASDSGTVSSSWYASDGWGGGYGIYCMIEHENGRSTLYAHMSAITVSPGQTVSQGQVIGYVGSTGDSSGPHLHYETRLWGVRYDPMSEF